MKRVSIIAFILAILFFQCSRKSDFVEPQVEVTAPDPISARLQGNVYNENGLPAQGVTVKVGSQTVLTDANGNFRINNASLDKKSALVTAELNGYFKAYRTFAATSGANYVSIKLVKKILAGTINATGGGSVSLANGAKVTLSPNGVIKISDSSIYSGTVNVYAAYIDPTSSDIGQTVPGSFMAEDKYGRRVTLVSYGMLVVELESPSAEKLQVKTGSVASITTPIPSSLQSSAPASSPLWYVNDQTGIWREEGIATRSGNVYVGDVKHFTPWNIDVPIPPTVLFSATIKAGNHGIVHAFVTVKRTTGNQALFNSWTDSLGQVSGYIPANETLILEIKDPCLNTIYSQIIGPFSQDTNLGAINVNVPNIYVTISGHLSNCNGASVTHGYAIVNYNNVMRFADLDASGNFSTNFLTCSTAPTTAQVLAVDNITQQQSNVTTVNVSVPATYVGNITACGNSSAQYVNYTIDGTNYSINSANGDPLNSYHGPDSLGIMMQTNISGIHNNNTLSLSFNHPTSSTGTFQVAKLIAHSGSTFNTIVSPSNVVLTNFPAAIGQFYVGTFYATYTNSTGTHTINGSFKVRKNS